MLHISRTGAFSLGLCKQAICSNGGVIFTSVMQNLCVKLPVLYIDCCFGLLLFAVNQQGRPMTAYCSAAAFSFSGCAQDFFLFAKTHKVNEKLNLKEVDENARTFIA